MNTTNADPDYSTMALLRKAVKKHCKRCKGLGISDQHEHFFSLAHEAFEDVMGKVVYLECSECGSSDDIILKKGEKPPNPEHFICYQCLHPDDEDA